MAVTSIGDMSQTFMFRRLTTSIKQDATTAAQELTKGYTTNIAKKLGGDLTRFASLEVTLSRLSAYQGAAHLAAARASAMQTVLGQIDTQTAGLGVSLLDAANSDNSHLMNGMVSEISQRFDAVLASLNAKVGDKTLFAGMSNDGPAVANAQIILSTLETVVTDAGATTAEEVVTAVTAWFDDPTGFGTVGYLGSDGAAAVSISPEDRIDLGFTATAPAIRDTLKSLAMLALVDRGMVISGADTERQVVRLAATALLQNGSDRAFLAGNLGLVQARIEQAQTRNGTETSALQMARSDLLAVDPYEAATRLEAAQTQLETLYSVTARLSRLRLVDFLR